MKEEKYKQIYAQIELLSQSPADTVSLLANVAALIHEQMKFFWTGFYRVADESRMILGPFQGPVACSKIPYGKGVCGASWKEARTLVVEDVEKFPGHIACSSESKSEIVVPLFFEGEVAGVLDIDSEKLATFDETDRLWLEKIVRLFENKVPRLSTSCGDAASFDQVRNLLADDRSRRRFDQSHKIDVPVLEKLVGLTRLCASGRNLQPLRYRIVHSEEECAKVFPLLAWAGYLPEWDGPEEGERPAAYLVQCLDTTLTQSLLCDDGLQLQAITLGATALGLGGCIVKAFNPEEVREVLDLPEEMEPRYVLALGKPIEKVELEDTDGTHTADIKYFRTGVTHHVPKRPLAELLIKKIHNLK